MLWYKLTLTASYQADHIPETKALTEPLETISEKNPNLSETYFLVLSYFEL